jgi:hypothetical protein
MTYVYIKLFFILSPKNSNEQWFNYLDYVFISIVILNIFFSLPKTIYFLVTYPYLYFYIQLRDLQRIRIEHKWQKVYIFFGVISQLFKLYEYQLVGVD